MAVSFSRPDPSSPAAVASASFATARRGFDADEVRDFLRMVSAELSRLLERERFLERELQAAQRRPALSAGELDEQTVTELLGEETARVLTTAREAAGQIRARAEEGSARLLRDAQDEAARLREEVELDVVRKRQDAEREAAAEVEQAKQQGRDLVNEARAYRERVLADMAKRRDVARDQIKQLIDGRERLVQAFERARLVTADVLSEITGFVDDTEDAVDFPVESPPPVPGPARMIDVELPAERDDAPAGEPPVDSADLAPVVTLFAGELDQQAEAPETSEPAAEDAETAELTEPVDPVEPAEGHEPDEHSDAPEAAPHDETDEPQPVKPSVNELFARLKAAKADDIAREVVAAVDAESAAGEGGAAQPEPAARTTRGKAADAAAATEGTEVPEAIEATEATDSGGPIELAELEESPFVRRDDDLAHLEVTLARRLKRVLADEQSDLLDVLRGKAPVRSLDAVLPEEADQVRMYAEAAADDLRAAALLGAASMAHDPSAALERRVTDADVVSRVTHLIGSELVLPLRERVAQAISDADGDARQIGNQVRAIYREWKTQRLDDQAAALLRSSYGLGASSAIVPGTSVCWVTDPSIAPCERCEANERAGVVRFGDELPNGDRTPPAHAGCRCLLVEAAR